MLIPYSKCIDILRKNNKIVTGILHIGAHQCEELNDYMSNGVSKDNVIWIEANPSLVESAKSRGISKIYSLAVDNEEGEATFNITNNGQSSSLLDLGTHKFSYPDVIVSNTIIVNKLKLSSFFQQYPEIDHTKLNFWNLDIQGSELNALKSAEDYLKYADAIYSEVNTQYVYENCGLLKDMDEFLESKGFKRLDIVMTGAGWGDALWVRI